MFSVRRENVQMTEQCTENWTRVTPERILWRRTHQWANKKQVLTTMKRQSCVTRLETYRVISYNIGIGEEKNL